MAQKKEPPFFNNDHLGAVPYKLAFYETMELFIETLTGTCFELRVSPFETVISVKAKIQRLEGIPVAQQHLIWNNLELEDEYCLHDYNIAEGCTLKLVLAMRGGPINTRRVTVDNSLKEMAEYMEASREEVWEKAVPNKQVTFLVYREGDQLNFFRVVDRGDGTLTPVSESISGGSVYNVYAEEEEEADGVAMGQQALENSITMTKMKLLKAKMENMNLSKKPKKSAKLKPRPPGGPRACSSSFPPGRHHHRLLRVHPQGGQSHATTTHLPPIENQQQPSDPGPSFSAALSAHMPLSSLPECASTGQALPLFAGSNCYMLQEEESWECPVSKVRPPPKVSRLDMGGSKLCPLSLCPSGVLPEGSVGDLDLKGRGLALLNEASLPEKQKLVPLSDLLQEPLSLELPAPKEGSMEALGAVAKQLPAAPLLSEAVASSSAGGWSVGAKHVSDGARLSALHLPTEPPAASSSSSSSPSSHRLLQPFDFTGASLRSNPPHCRLPLDDRHPHGSPVPPNATSPTAQFGAPSRSVLSRTEARDITKMANKAAKEPLGSVSSAELLASLARRSGGGSNGGREGPLGAAAAAPPRVLERLEGICGPEPQLQARLQASLQELQQDLLRRICPLQRPAVSHPSVNSLGASGPSSIIRRLGTPTYHLPPVKPPLSSKKKSSKHCFFCGKKTGLATSYECRCGNNFCASHRYAETHDCTYDYKTAGRRLLQETNPIISAPKLPKI
ncbi:AN1-type zinc finger protein 4 [Alosa sapidissima]|uniref:AN1-type zinc finger protein 4 n=1 Tax=Alosa sapidissima TaxID=34773 RepID=UPI001C0880B3|nr:AN1-type zinc finger protein 4 [Alosa sapidissima]